MSDKEKAEVNIKSQPPKGEDQIQSKRFSKGKKNKHSKDKKYVVNNGDGNNPNMGAVLHHFEDTELKNKPGMTYFADPDPNAKPVDGFGVTIDQQDQIIGDFLIKEQYPYEITKPYAEAMKLTMIYGSSKPEVILEAINQLYLVSYVTGCAHVLNSANEGIYSEFKSMRAFTNQSDLCLPKFLNAYLSILGNFNSKLGRMELRYAGVYLQGWSTLAHEYYIQLRNVRPLVPRQFGSKIEFPVFHGRHGIAFIKQKICTWFNELVSEFPIDSRGRVIMVATPKLTESNIEDYVMQPEYQFSQNAAEIRQALNQVQLWLNRQYFGHVNIDGKTFDLRDEFDIKLTNDNLVQDFQRFVRVPKYAKDFFKTDDRIISKEGSPAQLIGQGEDSRVIICPVPIADSDAWVGYITSPCLDFKINPTYRARFQNDVIEIESKMVENDSYSANDIRITSIN